MTVRDERDLFADIVSDPAKLLSHLLDARGVEPSYEYAWAGENGEDLPARICIPRDLAVKVFGHRYPCGDPACERCIERAQDECDEWGN